MRPLILFCAFSLFFGTISAQADNKKMPIEISKYLAKQHPIIKKKLFNSKNRWQKIVYFCIDENLKGGDNEGASNPANVHCEIALFNKVSKKWILGDEKSLKYGSVKKFSKNKLFVESITYSASDALCCPSIRKNLSFNSQNGKLNPTP